MNALNKSLLVFHKFMWGIYCSEKLKSTTLLTKKADQDFFEKEISMQYLFTYHCSEGFPNGSDDKESAYNVGDLGLIPGLGWSPGGGHGNLLQYSCLENPRGQRSLVQYSLWGRRVAHGWVTKQSTLLRVWHVLFFFFFYPMALSAITWHM